MENKLNKNLIIVFLALFVIVIVGYFLLSDKKDTYKGVYYPAGGLFNEQEYIFSPEFELLTECFSWALQMNTNRVQQGLSSNIGFTDKAYCGLNCDFEKVSVTSEGVSRACKETYEVPL
ncbi:MAG: hypothetical protein KAV41_03045 [Candidatus Pacebacteria bacterium]|nr:hypothetical protein [Candidatus Paceibacterota bacterium]